MIRSILHLRPAPGRSRDLVRYIREEGIISRAVSLKGCLSAEVASSISVGEDVVVTALWKSIEDYDAWLASPDRLRSGAGMLPLLNEAGDEVSGARLYDIEQTDARTDAVGAAWDKISTRDVTRGAGQ